MEYLAAHAGNTRVHDSVTGEKDLVRLPGLVAVAYQHEASRCGDPHLHTHVVVPNRQARAARHAAARHAAARTPFNRARLAAAATRIEKAAFTRADLIEIVGAQLPVDGEQSPRAAVEAAVDEIGMRLTAPRAAHEREGHERFTLDRILAEEMAVMDLVDAQTPRAMLWVKDEDTAGLSPEQLSRTSEAHPGWFNRSVPRRVRVRPLHCGLWPSRRATATTAMCCCWRRLGTLSMSRCAKAPATPV
jgi:hypothetical protein